MENIEYFNEHLLPGQVGQVAIILGFVAAVVAAIAFFSASRKNTSDITTEGWLKMGRFAFVIHGLCTFATIGLVFYVMVNQYYEYQYVQAHVSADLDFRYIFSAFWEGQEGSFMLWMFWHIVLGCVLMATAKKWEAGVMGPLALLEVFLASMLLGVYVGWGDDPFRLGSNPLLLLRQTMDAPIFANADYVALLEGNGLNPLLQNYWMTIHPPTLFLGFAAVTVPFCFAVAGLLYNEHKAWLKPALPWALFAAGILGIGILMGAAWAYEALTFGGYWAWDPVENSSLVPWLILVAGIHTHLIARATGRSIRATYFFYILALVMILYSTYMTRSGVLGETSVHAFTEMGLDVQLLGMILACLGLGVGLLIWRRKAIPSIKQEEALSSKEFWMFMGACVLLFSGVLLTVSTSLPVWNKIVQYFDPGYAGIVLSDPVDHHNRFQIWVGILVGLFSAGTQFLRWREKSWAGHSKKFWINFGSSFGLALLLTIVVAQYLRSTHSSQILLLFAGWFTIIANGQAFFTMLARKTKAAGSVLSHLGFGIMLLGILFSGLNKFHISENPFLMEGLLNVEDAESFKRNILLYDGVPMKMGDYEVTYVSDTLDQFTRTYRVDYKHFNKDGSIREAFNLDPNILYTRAFDKVAASNPATKHYLTHDVFTLIARLHEAEQNKEDRQRLEDSLKYRHYLPAFGEKVPFKDTIILRDLKQTRERGWELEVTDWMLGGSHPEYEALPGDLPIMVRVGLTRSDDDSTYYGTPLLVLRDQLIFSYPAQVDELNARITIHESVFNQLLADEAVLDYQPLAIKRGESANWNGHQLILRGFDAQANHPRYEAQDGDIAVQAKLEAKLNTGQSIPLEPLYYIRDNRPFNLKDVAVAQGIHMRFVGIDTETETANFMIAQAPPQMTAVPLAIATNSPRTDFIVLEAIVFPGINLVWLGSILLMAGLIFSMFVRIRERKKGLYAS